MSKGERFIRKKVQHYNETKYIEACCAMHVWRI